MTRHWNGRFRPAFLAAAALIVFSTITRIVFALRSDVAGLSALDYAEAFARGFYFDVATAIMAVTPMVLLLALPPAFLARVKLFRLVVLACFAGALFMLLFNAAAEWLFWDEFGGRFNFIAVDYLLYTHEVIGNIRESYPLGTILAGIGAIAVLLTGFVARGLWASLEAPAGWRFRMGALAIHAALVTAVIAMVDSDQKAFSSRDAANELAGNGIFDFFAANRRNELSFDRFYRTVPQEEAVRLVRAAFPGASWVPGQGDGIERRIDAGAPEKPWNVVLVSVESLGSEFLGAYGDPRGLTPNLDRLAKESLWFTNLYATGNRTVRGMEALALAIPPTPGQSIVRRPNNENLFSLGSVFGDKGYDVVYAYGGYGYFDNLSAFFGANRYRVVDRTAIPADKVKFENIWGVADEHLYEHVIEEIDSAKAKDPTKPVFVHVMTTSNHRPYTYPEGRVDIPSGSGREGAVKYTDWTIGRLLEDARQKPWFADTLFVITADHGANARGTSRIPVDKYRIPLFVYAPAHVKPARVDRLMSQIDIAPTLLGMMDFSYWTKFMGRDLLHSDPSTDRAFIANYQTLGYLKGDRFVTLTPKHGVQGFALGQDGSLVDAPVDEAQARESIAFYQLASYAFRTGLLRDERQLAPEKRAERRAPAARSAHGTLADMPTPPR